MQQATDLSCHRTIATESEQVGTVVVDTASLETQAASMYNADPEKYPSLAAPPTLDEMMVGGSSVAGILASIFVNEQQPHSVELASASLEPPDGLDIDAHGSCWGHRRTQRTGDAVYVQITTIAPTASGAEHAAQGIVGRLGGTVYAQTPGANQG